MDTKNNILKEAFLLFVDKGLFDVSVNDIIKKAGIKKGGFYHYFKSKDELINQVIINYICPIMETPLDEFKENFNDTKRFSNAKDKLFYFYTAIPKRNIKKRINEDIIEIDGRNFQFLVYEGTKKYKYIEEMQKKIYKNFCELLEQLIEEGKTEGIVSSFIDSKQWAETLNVLKDGIILLSLIFNDIDITEKCRITFKNVWKEIQQTDMRGVETINA